MPVEKPGPLDARMCSIVGEFDARRTTIFHVGLLAENETITNHGGMVCVRHMAPPLKKSQMACHLLGWLEDLEEDERLLIEQEAEHQLKGGGALGQYIVFPAVQEEREHKDGKSVVVRRRFSCAGFVVHCYESAGRALVHSKDLPYVDVARLLEIWSDQSSVLNDEPLRRHLCGLKGKGPWPILLPAYLLHAIREYEKTKILPYAPGEDDWKFCELDVESART